MTCCIGYIWGRIAGSPSEENVSHVYAEDATFHAAKAKVLPSLCCYLEKLAPAVGIEPTTN
jgi:hypothetical protein